MKPPVSPRRTLLVPALALCLLCLISGCRKHRGSTDLATNVQHVVASPQPLSDDEIDRRLEKMAPAAPGDD